ncbi:glycosyl transferase family 2 [Kribbella flavida DSM 17836]|uniref:Glycosyl transferase family 2 n=1 Tax=Kribbella flavida (strain DSM 17836 / JCM 10339 / NBRC 14399) TaxID=479435 RepID=D2PXE1_KRIFD|nr:glycosyltransferase [Kribbella flavida]ADB29789.1 glycosyl transferase family 2 [Kribbella flavida DSM 17836]
MERSESSPAPAVTTVVVSRNRRDELLASLARHQGPVVLVDNGSTDGTAEMVTRRYPSTELVPLATNLGAQARNIGVELARTPYVAFADDDSWWAPGSLAAATRIFDRYPRIGLLAARILLRAEEVEDPLCRLMEYSPLPDSGELPGRPILGFAACAAVVRRDAFLSVGGFDPVVFFAGEEERVAYDLAAAGWALRYVPELVVHHHPSPTRNRRGRDALVARNTLLTAVMRRPWPVAVRQVAAATGTGGVRAVVSAVPRLPAALRARQTLPADLEVELRQLAEWQATFPTDIAAVSDAVGEATVNGAKG